MSAVNIENIRRSLYDAAIAELYDKIDIDPELLREGFDAYVACIGLELDDGYNPSLRTELNEINFPSSVYAVSADGTWALDLCDVVVLANIYNEMVDF